MTDTNQDKTIIKPLLIGISGRSSSGKSMIVSELTKNNNDVLHIPSDNFYKKEAPKQYMGNPNWDCPEAIRFDKLIEAVNKLKNGESAFIPEERWTEIFNKEIFPKKRIIIEGFVLFANQELVNLLDKKIFVDVSDVNILYRKFKRFIRTKDSISLYQRLKQQSKSDDEIYTYMLDYIRWVAIPLSKEYEEIQKANADIIIDGNKPRDEVLNEVREYLNLK